MQDHQAIVAAAHQVVSRIERAVKKEGMAVPTITWNADGTFDPSAARQALRLIGPNNAGEHHFQFDTSDLIGAGRGSAPAQAKIDAIEHQLIAKLRQLMPRS